MADTKISALTDGTTADATDRLPAARSPFGATDNRYITPAYLATYLRGLANTWAAQQTFDYGTLTASTPTRFLQTWNNAAVAFTGLLFNATDTASAAGALLMDLQVGGASKASIAKDGGATFAGIAQGGGLRSYKNSGSVAPIDVRNAAGSTSYFKLFDDNAADILALRNGTTAQTLRVYNTYTDVTNYERGELSWVSNELYLYTSAGGTGTSRNLLLRAANILKFGGGGAVTWQVSAAGHLLANTDNTYDIGASGATRPRDIYAGSSIRAGTNILLGSSSFIQWNARSTMDCAVNGNIRVANAAQNDFGLFQFGGTTSSFPALKRSSTALQARLADDSDFTEIQGKHKTHANAVAETPTPTHTIVLYDASGQAYRVPCVV